jgi:predicted SprT family Zn-dependent metalloprotease
MAQRLFQNTALNQEASVFLKTIQTPIPKIQNFVSYDTKVEIEDDYDATTLKLFGALQNAYNYFKKHLFKDKLSHVVLTLNRRTKSAGYYMHSAWVDEIDIILPEININPEMLRRGIKRVMSTLVHELCHHYQYLHGQPGRGRYHNKEFAKIMMHVGLICSDTGMPGGKQTGDRITHYITPNGPFEQFFDAMPKEYLIPFKSHEHTRLFRNGGGCIRVDTDNNLDSKNKVKFMCLNCGCAAWGKPALHISCDDCHIRMHRQ